MIVKKSGYLHLQSSKPDTIGVALTQSPSGLAAYILEKFSTWTNESYMDKEDGGLTHKFTLDELIDNVMVYWLFQSITTSMRLYSEGFNGWHTFRVPVLTPTACIHTPEDIGPASEIGLRAKFPNLKQFTPADAGGHFAAYEAPQIVAKEAFRFLNNVEFNRY